MRLATNSRPGGRSVAPAMTFRRTPRRRDRVAGVDRVLPPEVATRARAPMSSGTSGGTPDDAPTQARNHSRAPGGRGVSGTRRDDDRLRIGSERARVTDRDRPSAPGGPGGTPGRGSGDRRCGGGAGGGVRPRVAQGHDQGGPPSARDQEWSHGGGPVRGGSPRRLDLLRGGLPRGAVPRGGGVGAGGGG